MSKAAAGAAGGTETVKVMVRVRPMNAKEKGRGKYPTAATKIFALLISDLQYREFFSCDVDRMLTGMI